VLHFVVLFLLIAPPEPGNSLTVVTTTSSSISFVWEEQFNGLSEITGARLEYTVVGSGTPPKRLEVNRRFGELTGLVPSTMYKISLYLRNRLGLSDPVSLVQQTKSSEFCYDSCNVMHERQYLYSGRMALQYEHFGGPVCIYIESSILNNCVIKRKL